MEPSFENTLDAFEKIFSVDGEPANVKDYLNIELLADRHRFLDELAGVGNLLASALRTLHEELDVAFVSHSPAFERAMEELVLHAYDFGNIDENTVRRLVLLGTFMLVLAANGEGPPPPPIPAKVIRMLKAVSESIKQRKNASIGKRYDPIIGRASGRRQFAVTSKGYMTLVPPERKQAT